MAIERIVATNNPAGRPSNAVLTERLARAREVNSVIRTENRALLDELVRIGAEVLALGRRVELAINAERPDVAMHVAGRLDALGRSLSRRGGAA